MGFRYNPDQDTIDIGGHGFATSKKFRDAPRPHGIEVRGTAGVLASGGEAFGRGYDPEIFRLRPRRIVSWGVDGTGRRATVGS